MLKTRVFQAVIVGKGHGTGVEVTNNPDQVISYQGEQKTIQLPQ